MLLLITVLKKFFKILLIVGIFSLILVNACLAFPLNLVSPPSGALNIPVDDYFRWQEVVGAAKYSLDIDQFTSSEDNIVPSVCSGGICSFPFLNLTVGNIEYLSFYMWGVTAYGIAGNPIDSSLPKWSFTTEQEPAAPTPTPPPPSPGPSPGPGPGLPINLVNPLKATSLGEVIDALLNFLFVLAFTLAPLMIIYAAILIMTAGGNAPQINKGRTIILWTLASLAIILLAKGLPAIIRGALGG